MSANPLIDMGNRAADRTQQNVQQQNTNIAADQQRKTAPYSLAIKGLTEKLATIDKDKDPSAYNDTVDQIQQNIHSIREVFHPDAKLGAADWLKTHTTDKLHITNHDQRVKDLAAKNQAGVTEDKNEAVATSQGVGPDAWTQYAATYKRATGQEPTDEVRRQWAEKQGGILSTVKPNFKNFRGPQGELQTFDANKPIGAEGGAPEGWTLATGSTTGNMKPIISAGVPVGIPFNGKVYLASDMSKPETPQEVKDEWGTLDTGLKAKADQFETRRKEQYAEMEKRQKISLAAANQRAMMAFQNQVSMGALRPAEGLMTKQEQQVYADQALQKKMQDLLPDALSGNQQAQLAILANHIAMTTHQPGASMRPTKALFDEAAQSAPWMQNIEKQFGPDGVLQGVKLSPEQMQNMVDLAPVVTNADTQTLEQMRKDMGGTLNPTPAQAPAGPKTQKLQSLKGGGTWKAPADAPPAPKVDGHVLKADGKVIAKSKGGNWVQP